MPGTRRFRHLYQAAADDDDAVMLTGGAGVRPGLYR